MEKYNCCKSCVIVVPVYKKYISRYEQISLSQCLKILSNYDIRFVAPKGLDLSFYDEKVRKNTIFYEPEFFDGISGYNKLMQSKLFYEEFLAYKYILIYQLDVFVFRDELIKFLELDYDYIGAPWIYGQNIFQYVFRGHTILKKIFPWFNHVDKIYVGNGGVSLRKVSTFLHIIEECKEFQHWHLNEDALYAILGVRYPYFFNVAPIDVALKFSFETEVRECWIRNGRQLPTFCHAWEKWDIEFWRPHFKAYGYEI